MNGNGKLRNGWGYSVERRPHPMLQVALQSLRWEGAEPTILADCNGEACRWVREVAECLARGDCSGAVLFCEDANLACCVANKVPGIRAAAVWTVPQAERAVHGLGANVVAVEQTGRTYFEFKQILRLCCSQSLLSCPAGIACVLQELDGHAHR